MDVTFFDSSIELERNSKKGPSKPEQNPSDSEQSQGLISLFYVTDYPVLHVLSMSVL